MNDLLVSKKLPTYETQSLNQTVSSSFTDSTEFSVGSPCVEKTIKESVIIQNHDSSDKLQHSIANEDTDDVISEERESPNKSVPSGASAVLVAAVPTGKYQWTKKNFCPFCCESVVKLARHLEKKHYDKPEVMKILKLPKGSSHRRLIQEKLRREGNFKYNISVLDSKKGIVMPQLRKPSYSTATVKDYVPCIHCKGFFVKDNLWKHIKRCPLNSTGEEKKRVVAEANLFLSGIEVPQGFKEKILEKMNPDEITNRAIHDKIILKLGESLFNKLRARHNVNYISQRMRQTSRLLMEVEKNNPEISSMHSLLHPVHFDEMQKAVNVLAQFDEKSARYGIGGLPLKLGHNLRRCADILKNMSIRDSNTDEILRAERFLHLMNTEYITVSANALKTLNEKKFNSPKYLPLAKDVKKFNEFINISRKASRDSLQKNHCDAKNFTKLSELTLVSILLFNRRRTGEIQRMTLDNFRKGMAASHQSSDIVNSMGSIEQVLLGTLQRVEILGKKGRGVPVLLRPAHVEDIETLISLRPVVGISTDNQFIFARLSENAETPLEATKVMRELSLQAKLESPELMRSTLLRKHIATMSQLVELTPSELQQLANFMGHDLNVHMNYYRLPDDIEQITKVGRLLIAAEEGKFKRANHAMNIEDIEFTQLDAAGTNSSTNQDPENLDSDDVPSTSRENEIRKRKKCSSRQPWTEEEKSQIRSFFAASIKKEKIPGKTACVDFIVAKNSTRTWKNIKDCVRNCIRSNQGGKI